MNGSRWLKTMLLCFVVCPLAADALDEGSLEHRGEDRRYLLYSPRDASELEGPRPLVVVLHGGGGTADGIERSVGRRFHQLADEHGFYVVYPDALDRLWDFGKGVVSEGLRRKADDLGYFRKILDRLARDLPIDETRIFATGISRGGQASFFLACSFPERIRAIAPLTMPLPEFLAPDCASGPAVGLALFNGTEDPLVPYEGGEIRVFRRKRGRVLSTDETLRRWRKRNGCGEEKTTIRLPDRTRDGTRVEKTTWSECTGAPVILYRIEGGGHTWPSSRSVLPERLVGRVSRDLDATGEIWEFFSGFESLLEEASRESERRLDP